MSVNYQLYEDTRSILWRIRAYVAQSRTWPHKTPIAKWFSWNQCAPGNKYVKHRAMWSRRHTRTVSPTKCFPSSSCHHHHFVHSGCRARRLLIKLDLIPSNIDCCYSKEPFPDARRDSTRVGGTLGQGCCEVNSDWIWLDLFSFVIITSFREFRPLNW